MKKELNAYTATIKYTNCKTEQIEEMEILVVATSIKKAINIINKNISPKYSGAKITSIYKTDYIVLY